MKIKLLAVGHKQPDWVNAAFADYSKRLPREWAFQLIDLKPEQRVGGRTASQAMAAEKARIFDALPKDTFLIALDERGAKWTSVELADALGRWQSSGQDVAIVIGGADGLDPEVKQRAGQLLSLSPLTLPHGMVRVLLAEQLYRAWSIRAGHPYHRE